VTLPPPWGYRKINTPSSRREASTSIASLPTAAEFLQTTRIGRLRSSASVKYTNSMKPLRRSVPESDAERVSRSSSDRLNNSMVLDLKQTAEYLRISRAHLSNVINHRVRGVPPLRCARIGRRILIKREWADEWLENAGQESATNGSI